MKDKTNLIWEDVILPGEIIEDDYDYYEDEYEDLYSQGYGFVSMHKRSQPTRHLKNKKGD